MSGYQEPFDPYAAPGVRGRTALMFGAADEEWDDGLEAGPGESPLRPFFSHTRLVKHAHGPW